jgi:hypothetical protein
MSFNCRIQDQSQAIVSRIVCPLCPASDSAEICSPDQAQASFSGADAQGGINSL